jgi:serine/threonine protein phosphatase PrpC
VVTVAVMTGRGLVRPANEDRIGVFGWLSPTEMPAPVTLRATVGEPLVIAVADGLGGHAAGEVASAWAVEACQADPAALTDGPALAERLRAIHAGLLEAGASRPDWTAMATTLTAVVVCPDQVLVTGIGDSRAYYVEPGFVEQLTVDDLDPTGSGALSQVLGGRPGHEVEPKTVQTEIRDGIRLLVCTDGLHSYQKPARLRELVAIADPAAAVRALHDSVHEEGAPDNVSVCVVDIAVSGNGSST